MGLAGRTALKEHLYWHARNVHGPEWAIDYLESAICNWTAEEIDFVDCVFNAAPVFRQRATWMTLNKGADVCVGCRATRSLCTKLNGVHQTHY